MSEIGVEVKSDILKTKVPQDVLDDINKKIYYFNNIEEMKRCSSLVEGSTCQTLGYYSANDGGGAIYLIREKLETDIEDAGSIHFINNILVAELIKEPIINVKKFGAKGDGKSDDTNAFRNAINFITNQVLLIPDGVFLINNIDINKQVKIKGISNLSIGNAKTIIKPFNSETNYLFNFEGQTNHMIGGSSLEDVVLHGNNYNVTLVKIKSHNFFNIQNVAFNNTSSHALSLTHVFESSFTHNIYRMCGSNDKDVIYFNNIVDNINANNCNNIHFENNTLGYNSGDWIGSGDKPMLDVIWIKGNKFEYDGTPTNANTTNHSVINLYQAHRVFIKDNAFFGFNISNNKYNKVITLHSGTGIVSIIDNKFDYCETTNPIVETLYPTCIIKDNTFNTNLDSNHVNNPIYCDGELQQFVEPMVVRTKSGMSTGDFNAHIKFANYYEASQLSSSNQWKYMRDENSINHSKMVKKISYTSDYYCIFRIFKSDFKNCSSVKIRVRAKNLDDGIDVTTKFLMKWYYGQAGSMVAETDKIITNDWAWYEFNINLSEWTKDDLGIVVMRGSMLIDGAIIEPVF